jgi:hypothetical protein
VKAAAALLLVVVAAACTSAVPTHAPATSPTPLATPEPSSFDGLNVGTIAVVKAGQLRQVADPNHPEDRAFESPVSAIGRILKPLGESQHVLVVGGPTKPNEDVYWRVADDPFPGCCAPFGWVRAIDNGGLNNLEPFQPACPDPSVAITGNQLIELGVMEASVCFRDTDFKLHGEVRCAQPQVNEFLAITGPDWTNDQTLCDIDQAVSLFGPAVTDLFASGQTENGQIFDEDADLTAHYNDASSKDCRWAPGNYGPIPLDEAPVDTAQFACRMSVYVTKAAVSGTQLPQGTNGDRM